MYAKILLFIAIAACVAEASIFSSFNEAWSNHLYKNMVPGVLTLGPLDTLKIVPASDVASASYSNSDAPPMAMTAFSPAPGVRCFCTSSSNPGRTMSPMEPPMGPPRQRYFRNFGRQFGRFRDFYNNQN